MAETFFDKIYKSKTLHTPDVLSCLANLSNDEVFTPPVVVNKMLDLLPQELFSDPNTTFLDPACKTGVFLREIAKRLLVGLQDKIPDLQQRIDHIFHKQLFGIAITELTSLLSRRSLYCSKYPNGEYSVSRFDDPEGNIRYRRIQHTWVNGKCKFCGASKKEYDRGDQKETYAYEFIHTLEPEKIFNMKFDVIISNPPYQLSTGGSKSQAVPIYNLFIEQAQKLNPKYLTMIIPDRWFSGGFGLNSFRNKMLSDNRISILYDYIVASDCFPGVDIPGGVCYFLWDRAHHGNCKVSITFNNTTTTMMRPLLEQGCDIFIKYNESISIIHKILLGREPSFDSIITAQRPFGLPTNFTDGTEIPYSRQDIKVYMRNKEVRYINNSTPLTNKNFIKNWKVYMSASYGERIPINFFVVGKPFIGEPNSICTETYVAAGPFESETHAKNVIAYINSKFFRFLVLIRKPTQHLLKGVYKFVPMQDFTEKSDIDWSVPIPEIDKQLYKKYNLTQEEIGFIESMIKPME